MISYLQRAVLSRRHLDHDRHLGDARHRVAECNRTSSAHQYEGLIKRSKLRGAGGAAGAPKR